MKTLPIKSYNKTKINIQTWIFWSSFDSQLSFNSSFYPQAFKTVVCVFFSSLLLSFLYSSFFFFSILCSSFIHLTDKTYVKVFLNKNQVPIKFWLVDSHPTILNQLTSKNSKTMSPCDWKPSDLFNFPTRTVRRIQTKTMCYCRLPLYGKLYYESWSHSKPPFKLAFVKSLDKLQVVQTNWI